MSYVPPHLRGSALKKELRHKTIVVPMIDGKYVVVRDARSQDITFPGGGCGQRENIRNCAVRELSEETRRSINLRKIKNNPAFTFTSTKRSRSELENDKKRGLEVSTMYHVFVIDLSHMSFDNIKKSFHSQTKLNKSQLEMNNIFLMNKRQLVDSKMWTFMRNQVLHKL